MAAGSLLRLENIHKEYITEGKRHRVLCGVSLDIPHRTMAGLLGESGSGKTTLARIITGQETPDKGKVYLDESPLPSLRRRTFRQAADIQYIFQDPYAAMNPAQTVEQVLREPENLCRKHGRVALSPKVALNQAGMVYNSWFFRRVGELSGGQRQRVAVARALITRPRLLLADESTSMLDTASALAVLDLLQNVCRESGLSILFITHQMHVIRQTCEMLYVMHGGRIEEEGPAAQLLSSPSGPYTRRMVRSMKLFEEVGALV